MGGLVIDEGSVDGDLSRFVFALPGQLREFEMNGENFPEITGDISGIFEVSPTNTELTRSKLI